MAQGKENCRDDIGDDYMLFIYAILTGEFPQKEGYKRHKEEAKHYLLNHSTVGYTCNNVTNCWLYCVRFAYYVGKIAKHKNVGKDKNCTADNTYNAAGNKRASLKLKRSPQAYLLREKFADKTKGNAVKCRLNYGNEYDYINTSNLRSYFLKRLGCCYFDTL